MAETERDRLSPAVAGAGGGTGLIGLANLLSDGPLRAILIYLAPAVTVLLSMAWAFAKSRIVEAAARRDIQRTLERVRKLCTDSFANPNTTAAHRADLQARLESIEALMAEMMRDDTIALHDRLKRIADG